MTENNPPRMPSAENPVPTDGASAAPGRPDPIQPDNDLDESLPVTDYETAWQVPLKAAHCPHCELEHLIPAGIEQARCPACFNAQLAAMPGTLRPEPPELMLEFAISASQAAALLQNWVKGIWLRPAELEANLLAQRLTRSYLPMWLIDGRVSGAWQAEMGYDYQVASSQEVFRSGSWITNQVTETRIRWEPRAGQLERAYENLNVPALEGHARMIKALGNFDRRRAKPYQPAGLANSSVRVPNLLPEAAWPLARLGLDRLAAQDCQTAAAAQHTENFTIQAEYQQLNWTQLLLPVYTSAYRDEQGRVIPIVLNGQNGKIAGLRQASQRKANYWSLGLAGAALLCFILGLLFSAGTALLPLLGALGVACLVLGLLLGVAAPIPAIWAWNFNRTENHPGKEI